jgi:hypothetical protein
MQNMHFVLYDDPVKRSKYVAFLRMGNKCLCCSVFSVLNIDYRCVDGVLPYLTV